MVKAERQQIHYIMYIAFKNRPTVYEEVRIFRFTAHIIFPVP